MGNGVQTVDVTGVGFEPDLVFHGAAGRLGSDDSGNFIKFSLGVSHNDGVGGINEYAVVRVKDWIGETKEQKGFQVKFEGPGANCYASDGTVGFTGEEYSPIAKSMNPEKPFEALS